GTVGRLGIHPSVGKVSLFRNGGPVVKVDLPDEVVTIDRMPPIVPFVIIMCPTVQRCGKTLAIKTSSIGFQIACFGEACQSGRVDPYVGSADPAVFRT